MGYFMTVAGSDVWDICRKYCTPHTALMDQASINAKVDSLLDAALTAIEINAAYSTAMDINTWVYTVKSCNILFEAQDIYALWKNNMLVEAARYIKKHFGDLKIALPANPIKICDKYSDAPLAYRQFIADATAMINKRMLLQQGVIAYDALTV